jgi:hypothetical protein
MISYQLVTSILGLGIASTIIILIRRDHLHTHHAGWWLLVAFSVAGLGFIPSLVDQFAEYLNINYPPTLILTAGLGLLLLKVLTIDIAQSRQERTIRRLIQRIALLENDLKRVKKAQK